MARPPIYPGEVLGDGLKEIEISANQLAQKLNVTTNRLTQIIADKRSITGDTALRLGHWFKNSAEFWLNPQTQYDLRFAELEAGKEIDALPVRQARKSSSRV
jgi:antitoxin HigA-1